VPEFSKDQLDKLRDKLDGAGVKPKCLACQRGTMVLYRGQVGIVELGRERTATCVLFTCNTCGYVRMHSLAALDMDGIS
jgi:uncharacterized protein with GYD domain